VKDEENVLEMVRQVAMRHGKIDVLINNAGIASMNHILLTPGAVVEKIFSTNVLGTFLFLREVGKVMARQKYGRIVNFTTVATPLQLEGEAIYASSKAAIVSITSVAARELSPYNITVNAVGPTPIETDLIKSVPKDKMNNLIERQAIKRMGQFRDVSNVIDFFINKNSDFVTGQTVYLGGIS
jgi:3-oxoacyl-[acyl-carrier protein] reductase